MREEDAAFGGEVSGHYYFRDFSQADSGVVPFLLMLELISKRGQKLSEILRPFRERYFITGELNTPVADVALKLRELEERFGAEGTVSHLDGVSVDADDWHFNVRPSNTEPLLRLNLEAPLQELMERKRDEVLAEIATVSAPCPTATLTAGCIVLVAAAIAWRWPRSASAAPKLTRRRSPPSDHARDRRLRQPRRQALKPQAAYDVVAPRCARGIDPQRGRAATSPSTRSRRPGRRTRGTSSTSRARRSG